MRPTSERYELVLRAEPWSVPAIIRLRRLLKLALRSFGLRCVELKELPADDATVTTGQRVTA
jgi:hypothetical protein